VACTILGFNEFCTNNDFGSPSVAEALESLGEQVGRFDSLLPSLRESSPRFVGELYVRAKGLDSHFAGVLARHKQVGLTVKDRTEAPIQDHGSRCDEHLNTEISGLASAIDSFVSNLGILIDFMTRNTNRPKARGTHQEAEPSPTGQPPAAAHGMYAKAPDIQIDHALIQQHEKELQEAQNTAIGDDDE